MSGHKKEEYTVDRAGNLSRVPDDVKAQDGMVEGDGIVTVAAGDTGSDVVLKTIRDDAKGEHILEYDIVDTNSTAGVVTFYSATLDSSGAVTDTTKRSVDIPVSADGRVTEEYTGRAFEEDAIVIVADTEVEVGVSTIVEHREDIQ